MQGTRKKFDIRGRFPRPDASRNILRPFVKKRPQSALVGTGRFFPHASRKGAKYRRPAPITSRGLIKNQQHFDARNAHIWLREMRAQHDAHKMSLTFLIFLFVGVCRLFVF